MSRPIGSQTITMTVRLPKSVAAKFLGIAQGKGFNTNQYLKLLIQENIASVLQPTEEDL
jgi:hypothetical protein